MNKEPEKEPELKPCSFCGGAQLKRMTGPLRGLAMLICPKCGATVSFQGKEGKREVEAAWNRRPAHANKPLTLEELRGMDGEPVWVEFAGDDCGKPKNHWCFITVCDGMVGAHPCNIREVDEYYYPHSTYENAWLAYRQKPEGGGT